MDVVIWEHENFRGKKKFQVMFQTWFGLNHCFPGQLFTLEEAKEKCTEMGYNVLKIGGFYEIVH